MKKTIKSLEDYIIRIEAEVYHFRKENAMLKGQLESGKLLERYFTTMIMGLEKTIESVAHVLSDLRQGVKR